MEESFTIRGLAGQKKLSGAVVIHGAKNAALKAMVAAVLFDGPVRLENIPDTKDIHTMLEILTKLGAGVKKVGNNRSQTELVTLEIDTNEIKSTDIDQELAGSMRASVVLTGPLLARFGKVSFPAPGGCAIGTRPIDLFIDGYKKMGADIKKVDSIYQIKTSWQKNQSRGGEKLRCAEITFDKISVGATETLMMAAVLANGKTTLRNCAREPEIVNMAEWLNDCGANIKGVGTAVIEITGTNGKLLAPKTHYAAIPDRIEAGSFLLLGALCAKDLTIENCRPDHLDSLITLLKRSGVPIDVDYNSAPVGSESHVSLSPAVGAQTDMTSFTASRIGTIMITNNIKPNSSLKAFNVTTREYPGFPTDLQAQVVTFLTQVTGESTVTENIFEGRFKYVEDLMKMGAAITMTDSHSIIVRGPTELHQAKLHHDLDAHDIRAGFAVVMAALIGNGSFKINKVHLIDRGYERLEEQLRNLGADIERNALLAS